MQLFINIISTFFEYYLIALSISLIYNTTKFFHIAHAAVITISAYLFHFFLIKLKFPTSFSVLITIAFATLTGILIEKIIYRYFLEKNSKPMLLLIVSIGVYTIFQNIISLFSGDGYKYAGVSEFKVGNYFLGAYITNNQLITMFIYFVTIFLSIIILKKSKIGLCIRAVSSNLTLSNIFGINSKKITTFVFAMGSFLAAIVGICVSQEREIVPTMGFNLLLYGVIIMIIGGVGNLKGLGYGAILLATLHHLISYYMGNQWMDAITYLLLIIFLLSKPLGFSGERLKKIQL